MIRTLGLLVAATSAFAATSAMAQQDDRRDDGDNLIVAIGGGAQILPNFPGSDGYQVQPLFTGFIRREGEAIPFRTPDDGFGISLTGRNRVFEIGPMLGFQNKRDQTDADAPIGDVSFTVEAGGFVNINFTPSFRAHVAVRHGIGGHDSFVGEAGLDYAARSETTAFTIGPRVRFGDSDYMRTYYGVTPAVALASGLPAYQPDGGIRAVGAVAGLTHQLNRSFGIYAYAGYDRLVGDAADSPIARQLGSRDQFSGGLALYYSFRMRNPF